MSGFSFFRVESMWSWLFLLSGTIGFMALAVLPLLMLLPLQWLLFGHLLLLHLHRQEARQQEKLLLLKVDAGVPGVSRWASVPTVQSSCAYFMGSPRLRAG